METILQLWQDFFARFGYPGIAGVLAAITGLLGVVPLLGQLFTSLIKLAQQRKLQQDLHPFYTRQEIQRATQYYVETTCQNVAPSKDDEPGRTHAFAAKNEIIPFFLKKAFNQDVEDCQYYISAGGFRHGQNHFSDQPLSALYRSVEHQFQLRPRELVQPLQGRRPRGAFLNYMDFT